MSDPWKIDLPAAVVINAVAPRLVVPDDGWHAHTFAQQGKQLIKAIVRLSKLTQKKAYPYVARKAKEIISRQWETVIEKVLTRFGQRSAKATVEISLPQHEALWLRAIQEVFAEQGDDAILELVPPIQSVMAQSYSRVSIVMGQPVTDRASQSIARNARDVARNIVKINHTTRETVERHVRGAIDEGLTVTETAQRLREVLPDMTANRVNTITRTELNNAWNQGTVASFQESETMTHASVIGCESREQDKWDKPYYQQFLYRGESTCNIQDVPVNDIDKLRYHPNHTGTLIPSGFRSEEGHSI